MADPHVPTDVVAITRDEGICVSWTRSFAAESYIDPNRNSFYTWNENSTVYGGNDSLIWGANTIMYNVYNTNNTRVPVATFHINDSRGVWETASVDIPNPTYGVSCSFIVQIIVSQRWRDPLGFSRPGLRESINNLSTPSIPIIPIAIIRGVPKIVVATPTYEAAIVSWSDIIMPYYLNGTNVPDSVRSFTITSIPGNITSTIDGRYTMGEITGLTSGIPYVFTVTITLAHLGKQLPSISSNTVICVGPPFPPRLVYATLRNSSAVVSWTPPIYTLPLSKYTVSSSPPYPGPMITTNGLTTSVLIPNLTNWATYTFTVTATHIDGTSLPSSASNPVMPLGPIALSSMILNNIQIMPTNGNTYNYSTDVGETSITYNFITSIPTSIISMRIGNRNIVAVRELFGSLNLRSGINTFTFNVTEPSGSPISYSINIVVPLSDTTLSSVSVNNTQVFVDNSGSYIYPFNYTALSIPFHIRATTPTETISIQGQTGVYDISGTLTLLPRVNPIPIVVTAQNGDTANYLLIIGPFLDAPILTVFNSPPSISADISWNSIPGAVSYNVYQSVDNILYTLNTNLTNSFINLKLPRILGKFYFKVSAVNEYNIEGLLSAASSPVVIKRPPLAPTNLVSCSTTSGAVILSWVPPDDTGNTVISSYTVYSGPDIVSTNITFLDNSATLTDLSNNILHTFQVCATNSVGTGPPSSPTTIWLTPLSTNILSGNMSDFTTSLTSLTPTVAILSARAAINNAARAGTLTPQQLQNLTVAAINAINTTNNPVILCSFQNNEILSALSTMTQPNTNGNINASQMIAYVIPHYSTITSPYTASVALDRNYSGFAISAIINTSYIIFELPISIPGSVYQLTLTNGASSLTLTYDGTVLTDQNYKIYTANDSLIVGGLTIPLIGLGSLGGAPLLNQVIVNSSTITGPPYNSMLPIINTLVPVDITAIYPTASISIFDSKNRQLLSGEGNITGGLTLSNGENIFTISVTIPNSNTVTFPLIITNPQIIIDQAFIDAGTHLIDNARYIIATNLTMNTPFTIDEPGIGITIDGSGHTITVPSSTITLDDNNGNPVTYNTTQWPGLFSKAVKVQNMGILSSAYTAEGAGWFFQEGVSGTATNCYSTGSIGTNGGGIFGQMVTSGVATNCYSTGSMDFAGDILGNSSTSSGGIFGWDSKNCSAINCYSTGNMGYASGGIYCGAENGAAINCYSTGSIGLNAGGIYRYARNCSAESCYSTGSIGKNAGGIYSSGGGSSAKSCYSMGPISGEFAGGIFGPEGPSNSATNCYSLGVLLGASAGGIFGNQTYGTITNCYCNGPNNTSNPTTVTNSYFMKDANWSDASANRILTGVSGETVWFSRGANTPYLLVENPEPTSVNNGLFSVIINGNTVAGSNNYTTSINTDASFNIITANPRATVRVASVSKRNVISGFLPLVIGSNPYTIEVIAQNGQSVTYTLTIVKYVLRLTVSAPPFKQSVGLSWAAAIGAVNYNIYQSLDNVTYTKIVSNTTALNKTIQNRVIGSLYFKGSAVYANGSESQFSDASTPVQILWPPLAPTNLVSKSTGLGAVNLTWAPPTNIGNTAITAYKVYDVSGILVATISDLGGLGGPGGGGGGGLSSFINLTNLSENGFYSFQVSAINSEGEGPKSSVTSIKLTSLSSSITTPASFTTALNSLLGNTPTPIVTANAILNARAAINNAVKEETFTPEDRQALTVAALQAINTTGGTLASVSSNTTGQILATMKTVNTTAAINPRKPTVVVIPSYSTLISPYTATIDLSGSFADVSGIRMSYANIIRTGIAYIVFELPNSTAGSEYRLTLRNGPDSRTLIYDGTDLTDLNSNRYTANDSIPIGSLTIPLIGLGSVGGAPALDTVSIDSVPINALPLTVALTTPTNLVTIFIKTTINSQTFNLINSLNQTVLSGTGQDQVSIPLAAGINTFTINISEDSYTLTINNPDAPCFPAGTRILTVSGYKKVEDLIDGELVLTAAGLRVPAKLYETELFVATTATAPYRIPKGTFGPAAPANDLLLSPRHFFQIRKGLWIYPRHAAQLSEKVKQIMVGSPITYYHVECPQYLRDNLIVDGTVVESFGVNQLTKTPYTYNERLKAYTRIGYTAPKRPTKA